jgi:acetyltransferase-like isoleucine patch superfamily enzyme
MNPDRTLSWDWYPGRVPENVFIHESAYLETSYSFQLFRSRVPDALRIGPGSSAYLGVMFDLGENARVHVGEHALMHGARLIADAEISIGDFALISWNVVIMDTYRMPVDPALRRPALSRAATLPARRLEAQAPARPIRIGTNVWIGFDACILPGVNIGEGSVVGARSVVDQDVPPYTVVAGNPARVIRKLDRADLNRSEPREQRF